MLPSSSEVPYALGRVTRREGSWDESITYFEQALTLEPRNVELLMELAETYGNVRQFPAALKLYDRVLDIKPDDLIVMAEKASIYQAQGNLPEAATFLSEINEQTHDELTFDTKISQLRLERNYGEAVRLLQARLAQFHFDSQDEKAVHQVALAFTQRLAGDTADAKATAEQSRDILEGLYRDESRSPKARAHYAANLSQAYAAMGEKDAALKTAAHAIMLWPRAKDSKVGPAFEENLVLIETIFGENSLAISTLVRLLETPYGDLYNGRPVTPALLRLDPVWDPLRSDPAFQKLCEENAPLPEKSIAVLPFENLSKDEENAFFASGVQGEILTDLAKIADLKVISRTSVMQYKSGPERNLREIAKALGVSHVVEGSVQRAGKRVRVSAQLIDARNDAHLWAQTYDRDLEDVFAIQSEIAKAIADQLRAKLSPAEKNAIEQRPTTDLQAYDLYLRAQSISRLVKDTAELASLAQQRISLLDQAVERDPKFVLAYCALAKAYDELYQAKDVTPVEKRNVDYRALAESALEKARRIQPDFGPVHLALAYHFVWANNDFSQARVEIDLARRTMPNSAELEMTAGAIARRQSRWDDAVRSHERAAALEPRAEDNLFALANAYRLMRQYDRFDGVMTRLLEILPPDRSATYRVFRTFGPLESEGELSPLRAVVATVTPEEDASGAIRDLHNLILALWDHDPDSVSRISARTAETTFVFNGVKYPKSWYEGLAARMRGDKKAAEAAFAAARLEVEKAVLTDASNGRALSLLAMIDAGLGHKDQAVQEAEHACDLVTFENSGPSAPIVRCNLAVVYAWDGQPDLAISTLNSLVNRAAGSNLPAQPTYGDFRWNPLWDPLRNDPRFEQIVASLAPKSLAAPASTAPEKSIAVLPLENLSDEKQNAFFAAGVQDELLSDLSKIADLKVVSRTSVMQYKSGTKRNLKEIAQQLGVSNVVEGSVGRVGNRYESQCN